jgi:4-cresol dehydrogenase (hydroxylating) flavoprotein subunit
MRRGFTAAMAAWRARIGAQNVIDDAGTLASWSAATFPWPARTLAVIRPGDADEAAACLAVAGEMHAPLHPVSRGRAWGLSSRSPPSDCSILDLSRLDRILDIDAQHGTMRIEPGVTFAAVADALDAADLPFHVPPFGGPTDASVLANALDRGDGIGRGGDRFGELWDLDVALTTGERLRTGHGRFADGQLERVHARPAGPLLEGLFSQSGFGCVLSGRLGLTPAQRYRRSAVVEIGDARALGRFTAPLRRLLGDDILEPHAVFLWDGAKRLSSVATRRAHTTSGEAVGGLAQWAASLEIAAQDRGVLDARVRALRAALAPDAWPLTLGPRLDSAADPALFRRRSTGANLMSAYWEKAEPPSAQPNLDVDRCGFLWLCPAVPLEGEAFRTLASIVAALRREHGVFIATGFGLPSHRAAIGYLSLAWDRDRRGADESAMRAHQDGAARLAAAGFHSYRRSLPDALYESAAAADRDGADVHNQVLARLRRALDPGGVLSPGRLPGLD